MRALILVLALACLFGLAALWHADRLDSLRAMQREAADVAAGRAARTDLGTIPDGWGVVVVGEPALALPARAPFDDATHVVDGDASLAPEGPVDASGARTELAPEPPPLADFERKVQPGESLSEIARARYGTAKREIVDALARYNGMSSADDLRAGQMLKLPEPDKLAAFALDDRR